jgi:type III secretory pathway component EscR
MVSNPITVSLPIKMAIITIMNGFNEKCSKVLGTVAYNKPLIFIIVVIDTV